MSYYETSEESEIVERIEYRICFERKLQIRNVGKILTKI